MGRMNLHALRFAWLEKGCVEFHFPAKRKKLVPLSTPDCGFTGNSLLRKSAARWALSLAQQQGLVVTRHKAT